MKPILFRRIGNGLIPDRRQQEYFDEQFMDGDLYWLSLEHDRSPQSHSHYFAALFEAWHNLPENIAWDYPTSEHLRKKALIRCGYATEKDIVCDSHTDALKVAAAIRTLDDYLIVKVTDNAVKVFTAKSQSIKSMGRRAFERSKEGVLNHIADLIQIEADKLSANAGRAA